MKLICFCCFKGYQIKADVKKNLFSSLSIFFPYVVISQPAASSSTPVVASSSEEGKGETPKPKKNRCFMCRKRVGLTGELGGVKPGFL